MFNDNIPQLSIAYMNAKDEGNMELAARIDKIIQKIEKENSMAYRYDQ